MNPSLQAKLAESTDQFLVSLPLFFGLIGLNTGASALQFYYSQQEFAWMRILDFALEVAVLGAFALLIWRRVQLARHAKACNSLDVVFLEGFVNTSNLKAFALSWFITFLAAAGLGEWTEPDVLFHGVQELANLQPPRFYLYLLTCCQCVSYALCFFLMAHQQGRGEDV